MTEFVITEFHCIEKNILNTRDVITYMILMVLHDPDPRRQPLTATTESPVPMNPDFLPKSIPKFTLSSTSRVQSGFSAPSQF